MLQVGPRVVEGKLQQCNKCSQRARSLRYLHRPVCIGHIVAARYCGPPACDMWRHRETYRPSQQPVALACCRPSHQPVTVAHQPAMCDGTGMHTGHSSSPLVSPTSRRYVTALACCRPSQQPRTRPLSCDMWRAGSPTWPLSPVFSQGWQLSREPAVDRLYSGSRYQSTSSKWY